jgi:hypothetical protein
MTEVTPRSPGRKPQFRVANADIETYIDDGLRVQKLDVF